MMVTAGENMGKRLSKEIQTLGIDIQMLCVCLPLEIKKVMGVVWSMSSG